MRVNVNGEPTEAAPSLSWEEMLLNEGVYCLVEPDHLPHLRFIVLEDDADESVLYFNPREGVLELASHDAWKSKRFRRTEEQVFFRVGPGGLTMKGEQINSLAIILACHARVEGMKAENLLRDLRHESPAYGEDAFAAEAFRMEDAGRIAKEAGR